MICVVFAIFANFSPTTFAVFPLIPASISSKTYVEMPFVSESLVFIASIRRLISPPLMIFPSGFCGSPALAENMNEIESSPFSPAFTASSSAYSRNAAENCACGIFSVFSSSHTPAQNFSAAFLRMAVSFLQLSRIFFNSPEISFRNFSERSALFASASYSRSFSESNTTISSCVFTPYFRCRERSSSSRFST